MPTVEIASINSTGLGLNQADFEVAIIEDNKLKSHRGLFYDLLKKQNGVIVHIGNPKIKDDKESVFFAGDIVDWEVDEENECIPENNSEAQNYDTGANQIFLFKFLEQYKPDIDNLLKIALDKSPIKRICFLTDLQFGPEKGNIEIIYAINEFWNKHDRDGLRFNTMYEIYE